MSHNDTKPVLSVHINTAARRRAKEVSRCLVEDAKGHARDKQVDGYVIVSWNKSFGHCVNYHTGGTMPSFALPDYLRGVMQHVISGESIKANKPE